jgi:NifU-like protein
VLARVNSAMASEGLMAAAHVYRIGSADPIVLEVTPRGETATRPKAPAIGAIAARPAPRPAPPRPASGPAAPVARRGSPEQIRVIEHAIDELRPHLQRDGGDCELVDVDGNTVLIRLSGACAGCQLASVTLSGVQARLADKLGLPLRVVPVQ